jgi:hypothetical protein
MSTTHHRTRIRATRANSPMATTRSITGLPSITRGPPSSMRAQPSHIIRPCSSSSSSSSSSSITTTSRHTGRSQSSWTRGTWEDTQERIGNPTQGLHILVGPVRLRTQ